MSILFGGPDDVAYFDHGFRAGVYAVMERIVLKHPELESEFYTTIDEVFEQVLHQKAEDNKNVNVSIHVDNED